MKTGERSTNTSDSGSNDDVVLGVRISHPDRVVFPDAGVTKRELAEYYATVAERMLPFIEKRPLATVRCPRGRDEKCFFQKHRGETFSEPIGSIAVTEENGDTRDYIAANSPESIVALAQFGVIEIHPWGATERHLEAPDQLTFDLDPGSEVGWDAMTAAARRVRDRLDALGLRSYAKLSGGKGVHVVVPLKPDADWETAKSFCSRVAELIASEDPHHYVTNPRKAKRSGKIFIDYLRNSRGSTSIAPYSARARPGAPVAVPIRWDELSSAKSAAKYSLQSLSKRLTQQKRDPWPDYHATKQCLTSGRIEKVAE